MCSKFQITESRFLTSTGPVRPEQGATNFSRNQPLKSALGQRRNVVSHRIKAPKKNMKLWFPLTYLGYSKRQEINPVETQSYRGQTPRVQPLLSDSFQWKLDCYQVTSCSSVSVRLGGEASQLRPLRRSTVSRRSDSWTNSKLWVEKSPHPGLEHVFQHGLTQLWPTSFFGRWRGGWWWEARRKSTHPRMRGKECDFFSSLYVLKHDLSPHLN